MSKETILTKAAADIALYAVEIDGWVNTFLELLDRVCELDLVFEQAGGIPLNFVGLCLWHDPTQVVVIETIPADQADEQRKRTLAKTSVLAVLLRELGYTDVGVVLLGDDVGKMFRDEGFVAECKSIRGCARIPLAPCIDFGSIAGHVKVDARPMKFFN